jgi:hypothetical protein
MDGFTGSGTFRGRQVSVIDLPGEARGVVRDDTRVSLTAAARR